MYCIFGFYKGDIKRKHKHFFKFGSVPKCHGNGTLIFHMNSGWALKVFLRRKNPLGISENMVREPVFM
jgi:hypothetical protein